MSQLQPKVIDTTYLSFLILAIIGIVFLYAYFEYQAGIASSDREAFIASYCQNQSFPSYEDGGNYISCFDYRQTCYGELKQGPEGLYVDVDTWRCFDTIT
jgi:hypothetical protein